VISGVDIGVRVCTVATLDAAGKLGWDYLRAAPKVPALEASRELHAASLSYAWPGVVWVERPMGRHVRSVADLSRAVGAVVSGMPADVAVSEITPVDWRRIIGLAGNASKEQVWAWARELLGEDPPGQDEADALAICWACWLESKRAAA
jgi:Holliday junction resolvasome RuvABC endonuclease subunit